MSEIVFFALGDTSMVCPSRATARCRSHCEAMKDNCTSSVTSSRQSVLPHVLRSSLPAERRRWTRAQAALRGIEPSASPKATCSWNGHQAAG